MAQSAVQNVSGASRGRRISEDRSLLPVEAGSVPTRRHSVACPPLPLAADTHGRPALTTGPITTSGSSSPSLTKVTSKPRRNSVAGPPPTGLTGRSLNVPSDGTRRTSSPMSTRSRRASVTAKPITETAEECLTSTDVIDVYIKEAEYRPSPGPPLPSGSLPFTVAFQEISQTMERKQEDDYNEVQDKENLSKVSGVRRHSNVRFVLPTD